VNFRIYVVNSWLFSHGFSDLHVISASVCDFFSLVLCDNTFLHMQTSVN
jgi:hypothetical protein